MASSGIVDLIKSQHKEVDTLYKTYQNTEKDGKLAIAHQIIRKICIHGESEEMVLYPFLKTKGIVDKVDHSLQEHLQLKKDLAVLDGLDNVDDPNYDSTLHKAMKELLHHIEEEETDMLPSLEKHASQDELKKLLEDFQKAMTQVPTRPHPSAPLEGPAKTVAGMGAKVVDSVRDTVRGVNTGS